MNESNILPDDFRLTAYALGELEGESHEQMAKAVRADPGLRAAVVEISALAATLRRAFAQEAAEPLPPAKAIRQSPAPLRSALRVTWLGGLAAAALVTIFLGKESPRSAKLTRAAPFAAEPAIPFVSTRPVAPATLRPISPAPDNLGNPAKLAGFTGPSESVGAAKANWVIPSHLESSVGQDAFGLEERFVSSPGEYPTEGSASPFKAEFGPLTPSSDFKFGGDLRSSNQGSRAEPVLHRGIVVFARPPFGGRAFDSWGSPDVSPPFFPGELPPFLRPPFGPGPLPDIAPKPFDYHTNDLRWKPNPWPFGGGPPLLLHPAPAPRPAKRFAPFEILPISDSAK